MYYVATEREKLVEYLPKGAVAAEIGVAHGAFAAVLLEKTAPRQLHLVDPWSHNEGDDRGELLASVAHDRAGPAPAPPPNAAGEEIFGAVQGRFRGDRRASFHRQYSYRAAGAFPDRHFDFVYLDGDHRYEYVLRDLLDFSEKIKDDGLILGHDFFEDEFAAKENYGVVGAVGTFLARTNFVFVALTHELFPTFVLARRIDGFAASFTRNLLDSEVFLLDLPASLASGYRELAYKRRDGSTRRIPSFARV